MTTETEAELTLQDIRNARRAIEHCYEQGWTDGMPVVPAIPEFVDEFLAYTTRAPNEVICQAPHLRRTCTVRDAAVAGVMAGCRPDYFPLLVALVEAFSDIGPVMSQSTTGRAYAVIINGPIRDRLGINYTHNIFGPGDRANATLGRALRLVVLNVFDIRPHELDQSTHGTPGKYTLVIGENEEANPWEPLHVEHGFSPEVSTVTIQQARSTMHIDHRTTQVPEEILYTMARSMSYLGHATASASAGGRILQTNEAYHRNLGCVVVIGPEHARHIGSAGWSKSDVRQFLFKHWGNTAGELRMCGEPPEIEGLPDDAFIGASGTPESIMIVVSGADNAGESTLLPGYGRLAGPKVVEE